MPDLLLELFSEEIPARMQTRAAEDLKRLVTDALVEMGLVYESARALATPRRLALHVTGLPARSPDLAEERKGPRVGAPDAAIRGFLSAAGLSSVEEAEIRSDPKRGDFYVALTRRSGRAATEIIAEAIPRVVRSFPWPKSMRWGAASATEGSLRWVRPLHSILCTFGPETEEPEVVSFEVDGIRSGDVTRGHRFMAPALIRVKRFGDYARKLEAAKVVLDAGRRRQMIRQDSMALAMAQGLELIEDEPLLEEVAGLVEWPVVLVGAFDPEFLTLPPEVIRTTIRANQKCFVLCRPGTGDLADRFILVANLEADDGGRAIVAGNEKVVRARLSDARFFFEQDLKVPLEDRLARLQEIVFHEKLGTQGERVARLEALVRDLAPMLGADRRQAARAARLAKADLVTDMVGEFPELQGLMGRIYAAAQGEDPTVARAIQDHYRPEGPADSVPADPVSIAVAVADKIDVLAGFWGIGEKPTGSKDPYALRRAALGVIRLVLVNDARLPFLPVMESALRGHGFADTAEATASDLLAFLADRLKVQLREQGARHDLVDAVFSLGGQDDMVLLVRRVEALGRFLETEDGGNLLIGVKRALNILRIEEKRDDRAYLAPPDEALLVEEEEKALARAISGLKPEAEAAVAREDFQGAMTALARLRAPVDAFFDKVTVNSDDPLLRDNRLRLLNLIREATQTVADFSRIEG